ncbi:MAG: hypothetical protein LBR84_02230 [Tannerella sp.]|jgi:hypothetical protein|nr:hypothetical protein [Tannerella sp.]
MTEFRFFRPELSVLDIRIDNALDMFRAEERSDDNPVYSEAKSVFEMLPELCDVRGGYAIFDAPEIDNSEGIIRLGDKMIVPRRKVCGYMKNSESIAVFIGTAGENFTTMTRKCNSEGDYLKGYVIDAFGSITAERMAEYLQNALQAEMDAKGLNITNRYSPGYCNWHLSGQKKLFELLPDNPCDITLTDSMLMMPIKSVSGIIGIGKKVKKLEYACAVCNDTNCPYRNILSRNM